MSTTESMRSLPTRGAGARGLGHRGEGGPLSARFCARRPGDDPAAGDVRDVLRLHARGIPHLRQPEGHGLPDDRRGVRALLCRGEQGVEAPCRHERRARGNDRAGCGGRARPWPSGRCGREKVLVLGAGPIGNLVAQAAGGMGAAKVMITDVSAFRLEKARECGVDFCIDTSKVEHLVRHSRAFRGIEGGRDT